MDGASDELLSCAALSPDEHRAAGRGHLSNELEHFDHGRIASDQQRLGALFVPPVVPCFVPRVGARSGHPRPIRDLPTSSPPSLGGLEVIQDTLERATELDEVEGLDHNLDRSVTHGRGHRG